MKKLASHPKQHKDAALFRATVLANLKSPKHLPKGAAIAKSRPTK
jgi:hypothetical protein